MLRGGVAVCTGGPVLGVRGQAPDGAPVQICGICGHGWTDGMSVPGDSVGECARSCGRAEGGRVWTVGTAADVEAGGTGAGSRSPTAGMLRTPRALKEPS